jgi:hypothetical protein
VRVQFTRGCLATRQGQGPANYNGIFSTHGFAAVGEHGAKLVIDDSPPKVAVCLPPGTELAFDDEVQYDRTFSLFGKARVNHKVARFRQIDMNDRHVQHDALDSRTGKF